MASDRNGPSEYCLATSTFFRRKLRPGLCWIQRRPLSVTLWKRIGAVARTKDGASGQRIESDLIDLSENAGYVFPASLLVVTSQPAQMRRYLGSYLLFVFLAVGSAVLIVYARSGTGLGRAPLSLRDRSRWWSFFRRQVGSAADRDRFAGMEHGPLALRLPGWFGASHGERDCAVVLPHPFHGTALLAIHDQQKRCRICLRRLGTPSRSALPATFLLNWSGTEMVCSEGHGVLYLPDSQANWLERDRWDNLDDFVGWPL